MHARWAGMAVTGLALAVAAGCPGPPPPAGTDQGSQTTQPPPPADTTQEVVSGTSLPEGFDASADNDVEFGEAGYRITHPDTGIEFVWVPAGSFTMGTSKDELTALWKEWGPAYNAMPHEGVEEDLQSVWRQTADTEAPAHKVQLYGFWISRTEVSIAQWRAAMGSVPRQEYVDQDDHPVTSVTYQDCKAFCDKLGWAVPTEAQWEYAARGPQSLRYPWGNDWDARKCRCYVVGHADQYSAPVGSMKDDRSWCGALDMAGNVSEWCRDWFSKSFYATAAASQKNPECTKSADGRIIRGGSWESEALDCRGAARRWESPDSGYYLYGFRPVLVVK